MAEDTMSGATPRPVAGADIRTFLFADFRGYTRYTQEHGDEAASALASRFAELVRATVPEYEGELLELRGDEALCVFRSARQALRASVELQRRLRTATDEEPAFPIGVGMGLDAGEAVPTQGGYRGTSLNLAARLCALAKPGEILATETVARFAHRVDGLRLLEGHSATLKGMARPVRYVVVEPERPMPPAPVSLPVGARSNARRLWFVAGFAVLVSVGMGVILSMRGHGSTPLSLGHATVGVISSGGGLRSAFNTDGVPTAVAYGADSLWVSQYAQGRVMQIDLRDGSHAPIPLSGGADSHVHAPTGIAYGANRVWVADAATGSVEQISPQVGAVVGVPIYVGNGPSGVAATGGAVWVTLSVDGLVARINPQTMKVDKWISVGADPTAVAVGFNQVWVTNESTGTVTPIDPRRNVAGTPIPVGLGPDHLAVGSNSVWVTNSLGGTVARINPHTDSVSGTYLVGADPQGVSVVGGSVWVAVQRTSQLVRLDASTGQTLTVVAAQAEPRELVRTPTGVALTVGAAPATHRGGTLTALIAGPWPSGGFPIDPNFTFSAFYVQWELFGMTNDGLVAFKRVPGPDGESVVPDLATSIPSPTDGGLTYSFRLRSGIRYSNGRLVHAADIRYSLERIFRINASSPGFITPGVFYSDILGANRCTAKHCDLSRGIAVSGNTITFHLAHPDTYFIAKLAMPFAVAIAPGTPMHNTGTRPVLATGPYRIAIQNSHNLILVRNKFFHEWSADAQPDGYPNEIVVRNGGTTEQEVTAIEHGKADWTFDSLPLDRLSQLEVNYPALLHPALLPATRFIQLKTSTAPFNNVLARRALAFAIDRNHIAHLVGGALSAQPTCQVIPPNFPGYRPYCPYTINPTTAGVYTGPVLATANRLVTASGTRGTLVRVCVARGSVDPFFNQVDAYLVHVLDHIGYHASADPPTNQGCRSRDTVFPFGWIQDYPGAADFLNLFACPSIPPGCVYRWLTPRIQAAYAAQAKSSLNGVLAWSALDHAVTDQAPWIPITTDVAAGLTARRVGNYEYAPAPGGGPLIDQMWVK